MPGFVHLEPGDDPVSDAIVVVDEGHRPHRLAHAQRRDQLVAGRAGAVDGHPRQTVVTRDKRNAQPGRVPVTHEILTHQQPQAADQDQAQPPVVEHQRARHHDRRIAIPVDGQGQQQRRHGDRPDNRQQGIVAQVAHHRTVHAEADEQRNGQHRGQAEQPGVPAQRIHQIIGPQAHHESQPQGQPHQHDIRSYLKQTLVATP
ncbi:hypothetical protein D3C78_1069420 [compost metagenome]